MNALFILIYLVSLVINLVVCYKENKRHIFCVGDFLDEIKVYMWFPILNTTFLIVVLDVLWEKFRNIRLK